MRGAAPTLHCPRCETPAVPGAAFLTCRKCALVFDARAGEQATARPRSRPGGGGDAPLLRWRWWRPGALVMVLLTAPCVVLVAYFTRHPLWPILIVFVPLTLVALYLTAAMAFNWTTLTIEEGGFVSTDRPLPLERSRRGSLHGVERLYVERVESPFRGVRSFRVVASCADPVREHVLADTRDLALARELVRRIEARLGLGGEGERAPW